MSEDELRTFIRCLTLQNAVQHGGSAKPEAVIGRVLAQRSDLRSKAKEVTNLVSEVVREVNSVSFEEQKRLLVEYLPEGQVSTKTKAKERKLPPLPNVEGYKEVHVRFCPNPDGALHLGSSRAAILCDEYAKMYNGLYTLRFDDSDPKTKSPIPDAYEWIRQDLRWLGVKWHKEIYQSDRLNIYYGFTEKLVEAGNAYVCTCLPPQFRTCVLEMKPCPCRNIPPTEQLARWGKMLDGGYQEGQAVVRVKTDLNHPNPAVRDWPALRIIDVEKFPHPRIGSRYRVWPLFAFCCGIDDHELGITHVIRGKEHLTNSTRLLYLYEHLGWTIPEAVHYGRLKIVGTMLSKSKTREGIVKGMYKGWDDPRLGTLMALRRRGFLPETIRQLIVDVGPKPVDATISWANVEALNRKLLDPLARRYFFVADPVILKVKGLSEPRQVCLPLHPSRMEYGHRALQVVPESGVAPLLVSGRDLEVLQTGVMVRLMELFNIQVETVGDSIVVMYLGDSYQDAREKGAPLIHWVPASGSVDMKVMMPDSSIAVGKAEEACTSLKIGDRVQFERFGFVRIDSVDTCVTAYYTHR